MKSYQRVKVSLNDEQVQKLSEGYAVYKKITRNGIGDVRLSIRSKSGKEQKLIRQLGKYRKKVSQIEKELSAIK